MRLSSLSILPTPVQDGRDSTERRTHARSQPGPWQATQVKQFLEHHADFHKLLLDELYDAVYFVDPDRRIMYWNHAAEALTGYAASEVVGQRCSDNLLCHVDETGRSLCQNDCPLSQSMQSGVRGKADVYLRCKDGHRLAVSVRVVPILDGNDQALGAVEVFSDIASAQAIGAQER